METLLVLFITARPRGARLVHVGGGFSLSRRGRHRGLSAVSPTAWQTVLRMSDTAVTGSRIKSTLLQDTTHLIQRPCYQRRSPCQDPAGNRTTRRPPDDRKEMQTAVVWSCFPFIRFGQNHLARHSERGKKTRRTKEEVGETTSGNGQAWSSASPRGQWRTGKNGENRLQNHLWCPNDPRGEGIDDDNDDGLPQTYSKQAAQNAAARTVTKYKKTDHITPIL